VKIKEYKTVILLVLYECKVVSHFKEIMYIEGVSERCAEENIWT